MIRVVTFNILGFSRDCASDTDERFQRIVRELLHEGVDIALLQEIRTHFEKSVENRSCAETRLRQCPEYCEGSRFVYGDVGPDSKEGVGIVSRHKIIGNRSGSLPRGLFGRRYLLLELEAEGGSLNVLTFHLEPPAIGRIKTEFGVDEAQQKRIQRSQLEALERVIGELDPNIPLIVGGDFNLESDDTIYSLWRRRLNLTEIFPESKNGNQKTFTTHPSPSFDFGMDYRYDHLCYRQGKAQRVSLVRGGRIFDKPVARSNKLFYGYLSDHAGVYADISINPAT